ncbi:MAG: VWA domain-containing protein [Actinobacteria bacterium]|nr:VWA domain-containing protein [Actinomycetota bacterium]NIS30764.1 VWA domain-containing protein [Actinomycetota bacterium]NIT95283.1 VWA domain-containing protein [Actinomycetota bacterium]NIU18957.1 VWA domain-containing protein [Actinomycetota bacterium]NIU65976.1 VWA domain-containing protein [Actinomycetota bacterium]
MPDDGALVERLVAFGRELRAEGLSIGSGEVMTYCAALAALDPGDVHDLYWSGRSTLLTRRDHIPTYDRVFRRFFLGQPEPAAEEHPVPPPSTGAGAEAVLQIPDAERRDPDGGDEETEEPRLGLVASDAEIWRDKAFSACTDDELRALRRIMNRIRLTPPRRRSRRRRADARPGRPDLRRVVREVLRTRREPARIPRVGPKPKVRPIVMLLDVSGSMSDYSRNLLQFAYSTRRAAGKVEVFCFGTRLTRITQALDRRRPDDAMAWAARRVFDWDGGTRIGDSIDEFVRRWGRRGLSRGALVIICSDGLDRGDPAVLADAMERLSRLCHRIVWVNPHKGDDPDFRPSTLGMMVAAPHVDRITSGHNLRSLEELAADLPVLR